MAPTLNCNHEAPYVAHSLRGEGFDASEDGTGRGTPLVPVGVTIHGADPTVQKVASYSEVAQCLRARTPGNIDNSSTTVVQQPVAFNARQDPDHWHDRTGPLDTDGGTQAVSYAIQAGALRTNPASGPDGVGVQADHAYTLEARAEVQAVAVRDVAQTVTSNYGKQCDNSDTALGPNVAIHSMQVRRLTPTECARLQGFPDDYLDIPYRGKPAADGPKYKALGNSWAVPVVRWIGERIQEAA